MSQGENLSAAEQQTALDHSAGKVARRDGLPVLMDINQLAELLGFCTRTVRRMNAAGEVPKPVKLRSENRWRTADLLKWIERGCPKRPR